MHVTQVVPRRRMVSSCLLLAMTACAGGGGAQKMAMPTTAAYGGGGGGGGADNPGPSYQAPSAGAPAHASISTGEGPSAIAETAPAPERPGLGTTFGESGVRADQLRAVRRAPAPIHGPRCCSTTTTRSGVRAHAEYLGRVPAARSRSPPATARSSVALVDETGRTLPGYRRRRPLAGRSATTASATRSSCATRRPRGSRSSRRSTAST